MEYSSTTIPSAKDRNSPVSLAKSPAPSIQSPFPGIGQNSSTIPSEEKTNADKAYEKKLVAKLDKHIIPIVMLLYLFSFLDRVNIGNARLYGMEKDLGLKGMQFQTAVSLLFVTYLIFEIPSNLVLKKFHPRRYLAAITIGWGVVATMTGLVQNYNGLIACRLILGVLEAGLFPGLTVYLTFFYTKRELALRIGYLFVSAALAGACGGLLAYCIGYLDGVCGMRGWRWILIIEGIPTVIVGVLTYFVLSDDITTAGYLSEDEKEFLHSRMLNEQGQTKEAMKFHWEDVQACFLDWRSWAFAFAQFGVDTMLYGYSTFLPTIIKGLGHWSTPQVQALTIPCYCLGALTYLVISHLSDKHQQRGLYTLPFCLLSIIGYAVLLSPTAPSGVRYFGCFLVASGLYIAVGLPLSWLPGNCPRYGKRTSASALQLTIGNTSGIMAPFIYGVKDAPRYVKGHAITLAMVGFGGVIYAILWYSYRKENQERREGKQDYKYEGKTEEEVLEMGDESWTEIRVYDLKMG
ncbi:major facilitator superfamily domain-containing protein [Peziza echinospora]|nr:major facilitator superfamily domain-containing protein [Peziza echinospora]